MKGKVSTMDMRVNQEAERLAQRRDQTKPADSKIEVLDRSNVLLPAPPPVGQRIDPSRLKMKKQEKVQRSSGGGLGQFTQGSKTERDRKKHKEPSRKTNDPTISQKMKGRSGSK